MNNQQTLSNNIIKKRSNKLTLIYLMVSANFYLTFLILTMDNINIIFSKGVLKLHSKKMTWLFIAISIVALPIISWLLKLISFPGNGESVSGNILYLMTHELIWIIFILLFNHYVTKQRIGFRVGSSISSWLPFLITAGLILTMIRATLLVPHYQNPVWVFVTVAALTLSVGFFEEFLVRGVIFPQILSTFKSINLKTVYISIIGSGLVFGCLHFMNLTHQSLLTTIVQVIFAFSIGSFFCALYIRSGSILFPMIIHALWDFNGIYRTNVTSDPPIKALTPTIIASVIIMLVFFVGWMFILLRPSQLKPRLKWLQTLVK